MAPANTTTISIELENKPGVLSQIVSALFRLGYSVAGQHIDNSELTGMASMEVYVDGKREIPKDHIAKISSLSDAIKEVKVAQPKKWSLLGRRSGPAAPPSEEEFFGALVKAYPDVVAPINEYAGMLDAGNRATVIYNLGRNLGSREFQVHYADGAQLDHEKTMKRMLTPALHEIVEADVHAQHVFVSDCPFCSQAADQETGCDFLRGYLYGFLSGNKNSPVSAVHQMQSVLKGDDRCGFEIEFND